MWMWIVNSFRDTRLHAAGVFFVLLGALVSLYNVFSCGEPKANIWTLVQQINADVKHEADPEVIMNMWNVLIYIAINMIDCIFSVLLGFGAWKDRHTLIAPWLIYSAIFFIYNFVNVILPGSGVTVLVSLILLAFVLFFNPNEKIVIFGQTIECNRIPVTVIAIIIFCLDRGLLAIVFSIAVFMIVSNQKGMTIRNTAIAGIAVLFFNDEVLLAVFAVLLAYVILRKSEYKAQIKSFAVIAVIIKLFLSATLDVKVPFLFGIASASLGYQFMIWLVMCSLFIHIRQSSETQPLHLSRSRPALRPYTRT